MGNSIKAPITAWVSALVTVSFLFALLETLQLASEPDWLGSASTGFGDFLIAAAAYAAIIAAVSIVPCALFRFVRGASIDAGVYAAAILVAAYVFLRSGVIGATGSVLALVFLVAGIAASFAGNRFDARWRTTFALIAALAFAAATLTAHEIRYAEALRNDGSSFAMTVAAIVAIVTIVYGLGSWARVYERRRRWSTWASVLVVALSVPVAARVYADYRGVFSVQEGPRVLIVSADTLRADSLSLYGGHVPTPGLEALAAEGAVFEQAYALSSWTVPSLCGLMASRYPPSTTADASNEQWNKDITFGYPEIADYWTADNGRTLFGDLTYLGIPTAVFMANVAMNSHAWLMDDFEYAQSTFSRKEQRRGRFEHMPLLHATLGALRAEWAPYGPYDTSALTRDYTRAYLRQHRHGPFAVWSHFLDPHAPYAPPKRYVPEGAPTDVFSPDGVSMTQSFSGAPQDRESIQALYEGEIRYVDECIGDVVACLDGLGLKESTLVCFTSDHGEAFWDHGEWGHGHSLHEELIRAPLIFRGPNVAARRIATPLSSIHVLPTLAGWMGIDARPHWQGADLSALLNDAGAAWPEEPVFTGATYRFGVDTEPFESVAWQYLKLIRGIRTGGVQLYDLTADPGEMHDLSSEKPDVAAKYAALLDEWNASYASRITEVWKRPESIGDADEVIEAFKALGYVE